MNINNRSLEMLEEFKYLETNLTNLEVNLPEGIKR